MCDRNPKHQRSDRGREQFEPVSQHDHDGGLQLHQGFGEAGQPQSDGFGVGQAGAAPELQIDPPVDLHALSLDLPHRQPELRGQMHA
jgi:hypothetical protein